MRRFLLVFAGLAACTAPSHIPNPILLPGAAISTAVENSAYNARRSKVKTFVTQQQPGIEAEIKTGTGPLLTQAMDLARVPPHEQPTLAKLLQADQHIYLGNPEALTVALMVHGP